MASKRASSNGPDVMDISPLMRSLEALHGVVVSLEMSPDGAYGEGGLEVLAIAWKRTSGVVGRVRAVSVRRTYPHRDSATFEGFLFKLIHELDRECSVMWKQETF